MSDIQEVAPENSLTDFPKDGVFFRVVYRNLALMLFSCNINITTVAENGENSITPTLKVQKFNKRLGRLIE